MNKRTRKKILLEKIGIEEYLILSYEIMGKKDLKNEHKQKLTLLKKQLKNLTK